MGHFVLIVFPQGICCRYAVRASDTLYRVLRALQIHYFYLLKSVDRCFASEIISQLAVILALFVI